MKKNIKKFLDDKILYLGVSGIGILLNKIMILVDPYLEIDSSFIKSISKKIKEIHIFISHGHYDHYEYIPSIIDNLKESYAIKIFFPPDIYDRDKTKLLHQNISVYSLPDYFKGLENREYMATVYEGRHLKQSLLYKISTLFSIKNYPELKRHFANPSKDTMNFIFHVEGERLSIGHIGSSSLSEEVKVNFKNLDILCLAIDPKMENNIEHMEILSPAICVPLHHLNSTNGIRLVKDIDVDFLERKYGNLFYKKEIFKID